jgi:hypothetical protein
MGGGGFRLLPDIKLGDITFGPRASSLSLFRPPQPRSLSITRHQPLKGLVITENSSSPFLPVDSTPENSSSPFLKMVNWNFL